MAPDRRLVDRHQVQLARRLAEGLTTYVEQELGLSALRPPAGRLLLRRLSRLHDDLDQLAGLLAALELQADYEQPPAAD